MIQFIQPISLLIISTIIGVLTYRLAKAKDFSWPKCFGFLAALFFPFLITALSAPYKESRQSRRPLSFVLRIALTALLVKIILILGDTFLRSPWLGSLYASTFQFISRGNASFLVTGNSIEFSYANTVILGSWASYTALASVGVTLGASFWQLRLPILCALSALGFVLGAAYDYVRWVLWFSQASSLSSADTLLNIPTTYMALLVAMAAILFSVAILIAIKLHNNYKQRDRQTLRVRRPLL